MLPLLGGPPSRASISRRRIRATSTASVGAGSTRAFWRTRVRQLRSLQPSTTPFSQQELLISNQSYITIPEELWALFRERGLKVTPQRELVFRLLHRNVTHPTAEAVHSAALEVMPMISLKTVYQVLNDLRRLGEIQSIELGTGALRFDPNTSEHHHLVCQGCGDVRDVHLDTSELLLNRSQRHGFSLESVDVTFRGLCQSCRDNQSQN